MRWDQFLVVLEPLLSWIAGSVVLIGAIVLIWTIYDSWASAPDRFSWFEALLQTLGIALLAMLALRARAIMTSIVPRSFERDQLPALEPMLRQPYEWLRRGATIFGAVVLVWLIYQRWFHTPERFSWLQVVYLAVGVIVVAVIASRAEAIITAILS